MLRTLRPTAIVAMLLVAAACGDAAVDPAVDPAPTTTVAATTLPPPTTVAPTTTTPAPVWRVVADETKGRPFQVSLALSQQSLARMWEYHGFTTPLPAVDLDREVVVLLTQAVSGSCPEIELADFVIAGDLVYGEFAYPTGEQACTADANPHSYVLAVERAALPGSFTLQLTQELVCGGCDEDSLAVDLDNPDLDEQLWGFGRILVVREGPATEFPEVSFGYATPTYGIVRNWAVEGPGDAPQLALVIEPAEATFILDAGRADCTGGDCGDRNPELIDPCRAIVSAEPGADVWAVYTQAPDGTCTWEITDTYDLPEPGPDAG